MDFSLMNGLLNLQGAGRLAGCMHEQASNSICIHVTTLNNPLTHRVVHTDAAKLGVLPSHFAGKTEWQVHVVPSAGPQPIGQ